MKPENIETHEACCQIQTTACPCPLCGNAGRKVTALTLDHHVPPPLRAAIGDDATFCLNPACEVVYCNPAGLVVRKGQTLLPVTIKESGDPVPVCYCFGFKRGDLRKDLAERGKTDIPERIREGIAEGRCACERTNPQGACCLGNVAGAIKQIQEEMKSHS
jgi:hypothetical protein